MLEPLLPYEEEMLLQRLDQESVERRLSKQTNRLRKKLKLRKVQRRNGIKVFDLDQTLRDLLGPRTSSANPLALVWQPDHGAQEADPAQEARRQLLDRLQLKSDVGGPNLNTSSCSSPPLPPRIWMVRGAQDDREILSPHTGR